MQRLDSIKVSGIIELVNNLGGARHSVRADVGLAKPGAPGVTRPTNFLAIVCQPNNPDNFSEFAHQRRLAVKK